MKELMKIKVEIAKHSGYCYGVERAMDITKKQLESSRTKTYAIGPLIHNDQAMGKLIEKGLIVEEELEKMKKNSAAIIRSHGLAKHFYDKMESKGIAIVDATCPFVKKIQKIVFEGANKGYEIIIIGDKNHPEIIGISGWVDKAHSIINSAEEAELFEGIDNKKYLVVVQTTYKQENFRIIQEILKDKLDDVEFCNTICYATKQRQDSAEELSKRVDAMIVVGGKKSSNTLKLAEICRKNCMTFLIETFEDLDIEKIKDLSYVGIVAGASTPDFIIQEVYDYLLTK